LEIDTAVQVVGWWVGDYLPKSIVFDIEEILPFVDTVIAARLTPFDEE
jgi:hypothetical protein